MRSLWLLILLLCPIVSYAQINISFQIQFGSQNGIISLGSDGTARIEENNFPTHLERSISHALQGLKITNLSIYEAQRQVTQRIITKAGFTPQVSYNQQRSLNNPFIRNNYEEQKEFDRALSDNIYQPQFRSALIKNNIKFNANDRSDLNALKIYRKAQRLMNEQLGENDSYREGRFSKQIIEIRQNYRSDFAQDEQQTLLDISSSILDNRPEALVKALTLLSRSNEFQRGLAASFANNFNPASFLYPIDPHCSNTWCEAGQFFGDAASALIGAYEFMKGAALTVGGGSLTVALAGAVPATGGLSSIALPATAGAALAGVAMAGHGLSTMGKAFNNLYKNIEDDATFLTLEKSQEAIKETGITRANKEALKANSSYETVKDFYRTLKKSGIESSDKKSLLKSFRLESLQSKTLDQDLFVYRWHNNDFEAKKIGRFFSPQKIIDPVNARALLALPESNKMLYLSEYRLKKGSKIFFGEVAPLNSQTGGGQQIFITDEILENVVEVILP